jgi:hypothetical protein
MKRVVLIALLAVLALPAAATAASTFDGLQEGTYTGTFNAPAVKEMNGTPVTMTLKKVGTDFEANVTFKDGSTEVWRFNDTSLTQTEIDPKTNKTGMKYGATKAKTTTNSITYNVNCADAANKKCDADIDNRANWTLVKTGNNALTYKYFGVARGDAFKADVNPGERIVIPFKYTTTTTTAPTKTN